MTNLAECQEQLNILIQANNIYKNESDIYWARERAAKKEINDALSDFDEKEKILLGTPTIHDQWIQGCDWWSGNSCDDTCRNDRSKYTVKGTRVFATGRDIWYGCWSDGVKKGYECGCVQPVESTWNYNYGLASEAKRRWENAKNSYSSILRLQPNAPVMTVQCCINEINCPKDANCDGNIQICQNIINEKLDKSTAEERKRNEELVITEINKIKLVIDGLITKINTNVNNLKTKLNNFNLDKFTNLNNNEINSNFENLKILYNEINTIITNINNDNSNIINQLNQIDTFYKQIPKNSTRKNTILVLYRNILYNYDGFYTNVENVIYEFDNLKYFYNILSNDIINYKNLENIINNNNIIYNNINDEFKKIKDYYNKILSNISTQKEKLDIINNYNILIKNNILPNIDNNIKNFKLNINLIKESLLNYNDDNTLIIKNFKDLANESYKKDIELNKEYDNIKKLSKEINIIYEELNKDFINYNNLLDIKKKIDSINNDEELERINNLYNLEKNNDILTEKDVITLNKIKEEVSNISNDTKMKDNLKNLNFLKESSDKIIKNFAFNTPFKNLIKIFIEDVNKIINITNEKYNDGINKIEQINVRSDFKKDDYESKEGILKEDNIKNDEILFNLLKEEELSIPKEIIVIEDSPNYTLPIIITTVIIIIIIIIILLNK
jgi:hypothetical protein